VPSPRNIRYAISIVKPVGLILKQCLDFVIISSRLGSSARYYQRPFSFLTGRNGVMPPLKEIGETAFLRVILYTFIDKGLKKKSPMITSILWI
jgi:hypothetical protein